MAAASLTLTILGEYIFDVESDDGEVGFAQVLLGGLEKVFLLSTVSDFEDNGCLRNSQELPLAVRRFLQFRSP